MGWQQRFRIHHPGRVGFRFRKESRTAEQMFSEETQELLLAHQWPGNVRELANVVEHASILCDGLPIEAEHLPRQFADRQLRKELRTSGPVSLRDMEMTAIEEALERHGGNKPAAANELGISLKTLYNKLNAAAEKRIAG